MNLPGTPASALALRVVRTLRDQGHEALLAGGCVRDILLGRDPKDFDVATSASPDEVEALFPQTVPVGKQFGVVHVVERPGVSVEVATFRYDGPYLDGRHPSSVRFTGPEEDAARRDFTVNALFYDPEAREVLDFVGGLADLEGKVIRAVGDATVRFAEDKLRLLRAVRFAASLRFDIEEETFAAVAAMAGQATVCSPERIAAELQKMLLSRGQSRAMRLMFETGLLDAILPEIAAMYGVEQPPEYHPEGDVFTHTCLALDLMAMPCTITLALGVLLHDVGKPPTFERASDRIRFHGHDRVGAEMAEVILRRLRFDNETIERVVSLVRDHLKFINLPQMRTATLKRFLRKPHFEEDLELHRIDCLAGPGTLETWRFARESLARFRAQGEERSLRPKLPVSGDDLIDLGLTPGPRFKELLSAVEDELLEGRVNTRQEALAFLRARIESRADG